MLIQYHARLKPFRAAKQQPKQDPESRCHFLGLAGTHQQQEVRFSLIQHRRHLLHHCLWHFSLNSMSTRSSFDRDLFQRLKYRDACIERVRPHQIQLSDFSYGVDASVCCQHDYSMPGGNWSQSKSPSVASQHFCIQAMARLIPCCCTSNKTPPLLTG